MSYLGNIYNEITTLGDFLNTPREAVASASNLDLLTLVPATRHINITGTNTINSFNITEGMCYFVRFDSVLTITNSSSIVTQRNSDILTTPGDTCIIRATADDVVELIAYETSSGTGTTEFQALLFKSDTSATDDSDPGSGFFKWNNGTQLSTSTLYFDNNTSDTVDVTTLFNSFSTGYLYIQQKSDRTKWQMWDITSKVVGAGYYKFNVSLLAYGGALLDDADAYCLFIPFSNLLVKVNQYSKNQSVLHVALTDASTTNTDASLSNNFTLLLTSGVGSTRTLANPTNLTDGMVLNWRFKQPASGGPCNVVYGSKFKWAGGTAPTLTTTASAIDRVSGIYVAADDVIEMTKVLDIR
jgi:hypothetical protein